jgi:Fe-S-cluster containining protein
MSHEIGRVYHASPLQNLTKIVPHISTYGQSWVYATDDRTVAAIFLGRLGGDFTCASGIYQGRPYLCERFADAFDRRYGSASGSIYVLPSADFLAGQTSYSKDLVCSRSVTPLEEIKIANAKDYLLGLAAEDKMVIKFHPERLCIPDDDEDLVQKAVRMYQRGSSVLEQVEDFHPHLLRRVKEAIAEEQK